MSSGPILGSLMGTYVETWRSGSGGRQRYFDSSQYGWMMRKNVDLVYICMKKDMDDVIEDVVIAPDILTSAGGKNANGTTADRIQWGAGFVLQNIDTQSISPGLAELTVRYSRDIPDAEINYPTNLTFACAAGVYTVKWMGVTKKTFDNGLGYCGSLGLQFVKMPQRKSHRIIRKRESNGGSSYVAYYEIDRYTDVMEVRVDGITQETYTSIAREESTQFVLNEGAAQGGADSGVSHAYTMPPIVLPYNAAESADEEVSLQYQAPTYPANLRWQIAGDTCQLYWNKELAWNFKYPK